jgi:hypothetical protein
MPSPRDKSAGAALSSSGSALPDRWRATLAALFHFPRLAGVVIAVTTGYLLWWWWEYHHVLLLAPSPQGFPLECATEIRTIDDARAL